MRVTRVRAFRKAFEYTLAFSNGALAVCAEAFRNGDSIQDFSAACVLSLALVLSLPSARRVEGLTY